MISFYEYQQDVSKYNHDTIVYTINFDLDFLDTLPVNYSDLPVWKLLALESYNIDVEKLYPDKVLSDEYRETLYYWNDPLFKVYSAKAERFHQKGIKKKKQNDYVSALDSNLCSNF